MKRTTRCMFIPFLLVWLGVGYAQATILIVSPHPDDDIVIAAGIAYAARNRGEQVTVVYATNGDFTGKADGYLRQDEAVTAQGTLGGSEDTLIFLGYPDGHLLELYNNYKDPGSTYTTPFGQSTTYGDRGLGSKDYHTYRFGSPATYNSYNLVYDLIDIIAAQRPDHILATVEFDKHTDHAAVSLAVRDAVLSVTASNPNYVPTVDETLVWQSDPNSSFSWPNPIDPQGYFVEPAGLSSEGVQWADCSSLDVPIAMQSRDITANLKNRALQAHVSQGGATDSFMSSFIHKDEFFWTQTLNGGNRPPRVDAGSDQAVYQGQLVQLNGSRSSDPDGSALQFQWRQLSGTPVTLLQATTATPTFLAPAGRITLDFELVVSDGTLRSLPDHMLVTVHDGVSTEANIAPLAAVTASSHNEVTGQQAVKAVDEVADGYPGDYTREWATLDQKTGAWLELNWNSAYRIDRVVLHDRPNSSDQITGATLAFGDGSMVTTGSLTNSGAGVEIRFNAVTTNRLRMTATATSSSTENVGLAEIEVYGVPAVDGNRAPMANAGADQTASAGAAVVLDGRASADPDGDALTYRWTQTAGPAVTLSNSATTTPGFTAPTVSANTVLTFSLIVNDGKLDSAADTMNVTVSSGTTSGNIAALATVTASSQNSSTGQLAVKAIDGVVDGYPGDYTREWATLDQKTGAWLELNWSRSYQIDRVVLHDRPNSSDQITGATLALGDGSTVAVGALTNSGAGVEIQFNPVTASRLRMTVTATSGSTENVGLAEIEVYGVPAADGNRPPMANAGADQTASAGAAVVLDGRASADPDGDALTYRWTQTAGPAVTLSNPATATPGFTAPTISTNTVLTFSLIVNDGKLDSAADTMNVTVTSDTTSSNIAALATVTASSQNSSTGQLAVKAADGVVDGYPGDYTREWATLGQKTGAWLELNWSRSYQIDRVVLHDRPNSSDQITRATLAFGDGSTAAVGSLTNSGAAVEIRFNPMTTNRLRMTVTGTSSSTVNVGLAEIEVYGR